MDPNATGGRGRLVARVRSRYLPIIALLVVAALALAASRESLLRALGAALVHRDPLQHGEAIIVSLQAGTAGALEAADLVAAGLAQRVVVFSISPGRDEREFARRGLILEDATARQIRELRALGVEHISLIPELISGTNEEIAALTTWCLLNELRTVTLVTTSDHSRRTRRLLDRSQDARRIRVSVQPSRHSRFDPDRWWHEREDLKTGLIELQKLALDVMQHPWPH